MDKNLPAVHETFASHVPTGDDRLPPCKTMAQSSFHQVPVSIHKPIIISKTVSQIVFGTDELQLISSNQQSFPAHSGFRPSHRHPEKYPKTCLTEQSEQVPLKETTTQKSHFINHVGFERPRIVHAPSSSVQKIMFPLPKDNASHFISATSEAFDERIGLKEVLMPQIQREDIQKKHATDHLMFGDHRDLNFYRKFPRVVRV